MIAQYRRRSLNASNHHMSATFDVLPALNDGEYAEVRWLTEWQRVDSDDDIIHHIIDAHLTIDPEGIAGDCSCGAYVEVTGRDESSRNAINNWITEHRKQNP